MCARGQNETSETLGEYDDPELNKLHVKPEPEEVEQEEDLTNLEPVC